MATLKPHKKKLKFNLTTIIEEATEGGYVGFIEEIPGVNTQGETLEEVQENIIDALLLALEYHRENTELLLRGRKKGILREKYSLITT